MTRRLLCLTMLQFQIAQIRHPKKRIQENSVMLCKLFNANDARAFLLKTTSVFRVSCDFCVNFFQQVYDVLNDWLFTDFQLGTFNFQLPSVRFTKNRYANTQHLIPSTCYNLLTNQIGRASCRERVCELV